MSLVGLSRFYFLYFGVLGVYLPFFNLYCRDLGLNGFQIGVLLAIQPLARLVFPVFWGVYADRSGRREALMRFSYLAAVISFASLLWIRQFAGMVLALATYTFFIVPVLPLWEATVLEKLKPAKRDYGQVRLWGSLGFIFFSVLVGLFLDYQSSQMVLRWILFLSFLNYWYSRKIPLSRTSQDLSMFSSLDFSWLRKGRLLIFLICCALMQASHGTYYGFFSIFMSEAGHSHVFIGLLWTVGVACEVAVMIVAGRWIRRLGYEWTFVLALGAAVVRWSVAAFVSAGPFFILIQALHGLTFGLFHVCSVTWVSRLLPANMKATAQSLYSSAAYGVGGLIGFLVNGLLYDAWGARLMWLWSTALAALAFALSLVFVLKKR